jgi:hypothetical protein
MNVFVSGCTIAYNTPYLQVPAATSPPRGKSKVNRAKAMEQLVNSYVPSSSQCVISPISSAAGTSTHASSITPGESVLQVGVLKPKPRSIQALTGSSAASSRSVSPIAPPTLSIPSVAASREVSPTTESVLAVDEDEDDAIDSSTADYNSVLAGIPWP